MNAVNSLITTVDLLARQGGLDPTFHARGIAEAWRKAQDPHWNRLALLSGQPIPNLVVRELVIEALEKRADRGLA